MSFLSLHYIFFLPAVLFILWIIPRRAFQLALVILSFYFYCSYKPEFLLYLLYVIGVSYFHTRYFPKNLAFLWFSSLLLLLPLFSLKYITNSTAGFFGTLPMGISFFSFQGLSYMVDRYKGEYGELKLIELCAFISFFPQLVAGPIERVSHLLPQLKPGNTPEFRDGIYRIVLGVFKKSVLADRLALEVNRIFLISQASGLEAIFGCFLFGLQIYLDFSAYCDIACGSARLLGIRLSENFVSPYFSKTPMEFWRRWHVSLGKWFRDYVYLPLGGKQGLLPLWLVFSLSGLWHGNNILFLVWGWYHLILYLVFQKHSLESRFLTFVCIQLGWLFFRAPDLSYITQIDLFSLSIVLPGKGGIFAIFSALLFCWCEEKVLLKRGLVFEKFSLILFTVFIAFFGLFYEKHFIYFQF